MPHRRHWLLQLAAFGLLATLLGGCGTRDDTGDSATTGQVRVVNALASGLATDVYVDGSRAAGPVANGTASATLTLASGSHSISVTTASGQELTPVTHAVSAGGAATLVAWGTVPDAVSYLVIDDRQAAPAAGRTRLQILNTGRAGKLDVHLSDTATALGDATRQASLSDSTSSSLLVNAGTYRLRLTGSDSTNDVRLDTPLTLPDRGVVTLVITPSTGGVLTHALLVPSGASVAALTNTQARMRLVSGLKSGAVTGRFGSTELGGTVASPAIGDYTLVPAGTGTITVTAGDTTVTRADWRAEPGSDTTVLLRNPGAAPVISVLADDHRPAPAGKARLTLLHGMSDLDQSLTLVVNQSSTTGTTVLPGTAASAQITAATDIPLGVRRTTGSATAVWDGKATLDSAGVYTLFLLGDSQAASQSSGFVSQVRKE